MKSERVAFLKINAIQCRLHAMDRNRQLQSNKGDGCLVSVLIWHQIICSRFLISVFFFSWIMKGETTLPRWYQHRIAHNFFLVKTMFMITFLLLYHLCLFQHRAFVMFKILVKIPFETHDVDIGRTDIHVWCMIYMYDVWCMLYDIHVFVDVRSGLTVYIYSWFIICDSWLSFFFWERECLKLSKNKDVSGIIHRTYYLIIVFVDTF